MVRAYMWIQEIRDGAITAVKAERGQDLVEYAVLVGAIGVAAAVALFAISPSLLDPLVSTLQNCLNISAATYACP